MSLSHSLSSTHSPSTSSLVASPGSSTQHHPDQRILVLGVTLGIVAFLLIGAIIFATVRMKHRKSRDDGPLRPARRTIIEPRHPASRVTPFGSPDSETPRFGYSHTPGSNMRIANRRPDGAWQFSDFRSSFSPRGISDLDLSPSSSSSFRSTTQLLTKEQEAKVSAAQHKEGFDVEIGVDTVPPPAYVYEHSTKG